MEHSFRHGDVNLVRVEAIEKNYNLVGENTYTLAEGEVTGHHHVITGDVEVFADENGALAVRVFGKAVLAHPEHKQLEIAPGTYKINIEQEKDWFTLAVRRVQD